jgi:hypothetical protein
VSAAFFQLRTARPVSPLQKLIIASINPSFFSEIKREIVEKEILILEKSISIASVIKDTLALVPFHIRKAACGVSSQQRARGSCIGRKTPDFGAFYA